MFGRHILHRTRRSYVILPRKVAIDAVPVLVHRLIGAARAYPRRRYPQPRVRATDVWRSPPHPVAAGAYPRPGGYMMSAV